MRARMPLMFSSCKRRGSGDGDGENAYSLVTNPLAIMVHVFITHITRHSLLQSQIWFQAHGLLYPLFPIMSMSYSHEPLLFEGPEGPRSATSFINSQTSCRRQGDKIVITILSVRPHPYGGGDPAKFQLLPDIEGLRLACVISTKRTVAPGRVCASSGKSTAAICAIRG